MDTQYILSPTNHVEGKLMFIKHKFLEEIHVFIPKTVGILKDI